MHGTCANLLKPTGYVLHQQFNIQQLHALRTNSDLCHLQHKLIGFYNRDEKCLQRGTNWVFKLGRLPFAVKRLRMNTSFMFFRRFLVVILKFITVDVG